jgi:ribonuclease HII
MKKPTHIVGIDEAGRGPLAGPVAVGAALLPVGFDWRLLPGVNDSKKLSAKKRDSIYEAAGVLQKAGKLDYQVVLVGAQKIDSHGISPAIKAALLKCLHKLEGRHASVIFSLEVDIKLDGGLKAPREYQRQQTIIKGDSLELSIGLASIMAKVTRDRYMEKIAQKSAYQAYDFAQHKGYGTKAHRAAISQYGPCSEHRRSFCQNILGR